MRRVFILFALLLIIAFSGSIRVRTQAATPPILVVVNTGATNPFGGYLAEILRAEGINSFQVAQLSATTSSSLANFSLVVLAETPLTASQATIFSNYVAGGGRLIAMRPGDQLHCGSWGDHARDPVQHPDYAHGISGGGAIRENGHVGLRLGAQRLVHTSGGSGQCWC